MSIASNPIIITAQPADQTVRYGTGDTAKFTVTASGDGLTYQWQYKDPVLKTWEDAAWIEGGNTNTVTISPFHFYMFNGTPFRCKITDANGTVTISDAGVLIGKFSITITAQPQNVTAFVGDTVKFTVIAEGEGLKYRWMFKPWGKDCWSYTAPINRNTLTLPVTGDKHLTEYCCEIIDRYGCLMQSERARLFAYIK